MSEYEPLHGYDHSLTISQIVGRMIGFDEKANEAPFEIVLDDWVEDAEYRHEKAERCDAPPEQLEELVNEVNRRRAKRGDIMEMYAELQSVAHAIYQGHNHPHLVLNRPLYERGSAEFTIRSAYFWAKDRGIDVPEWAPRDIQADANDLHSASPISVSARNLRATLFIVTRTLGSLIDKLEQDGHISPAANRPCINDNDVEDLPAIVQYILSTGASGSSAREPTPSEDMDILTLAQITLTLADLAEKARVEHWVEFRKKDNSIDDNPFLKNGVYVTARIYSHLIKPKLRNIKIMGQGVRSLQDRLNKAKDLAKSSGLPDFSQDQLLERLEAAKSAYADCTE